MIQDSVASTSSTKSRGINTFLAAKMAVLTHYTLIVIVLSFFAYTIAVESITLTSQANACILYTSFTLKAACFKMV